jgi:hypothetical protein
MLEGKKSVSSWKEKNVTLKEKHLHGKTKLYFSYVLQLCFTAMFYSYVLQLCFTKLSQKSINIK